MSLPLSVGYSEKSSDSKNSDPIEELPLNSVNTYEAVNDSDQAALEKRTMRCVDLRLIPLLSLVYSVALVDRINLGAVRAAGMGDALNLSVGSRYSIITCIYFIPYVLFQLPGNLVVRKLGARNWISFCVIAWGGVELSMAFVPTWHVLAVCRVLLGAFEASFFPALIFLVTTWYTRYEVQKRLAAFYLISITIAGFSPIMAYVLSLLDGKRGIAGWSWIFIIEGAYTIFLGVLAFFFIIDFPDKNTFLTPEQTHLVLRRVQEDRGDSVPDKMSFRIIKHHLSDWTIWCYGLMLMCASMPAYAIAYFITTILQGMGWKTANALLLSAPPYGPAVVSAIFFAWLADKTRKRAIFILIQGCIGIVGLAVMAYAPVNGWRYFGTFLVNAGSSGCIPSILAYGANNVTSHTKRAVSTAITAMFAGLGGVLASTVFREQDFPHYVPGLWATIGAQLFMLAVLTTTTVHFSRQNKLAREGKKILENQTGFLYTI